MKTLKPNRNRERHFAKIAKAADYIANCAEHIRDEAKVYSKLTGLPDSPKEVEKRIKKTLHLLMGHLDRINVSWFSIRQNPVQQQTKFQLQVLSPNGKRVIDKLHTNSLKTVVKAFCKRLYQDDGTAYDGWVKQQRKAGLRKADLSIETFLASFPNVRILFLPPDGGGYVWSSRLSMGAPAVKNFTATDLTV